MNYCLLIVTSYHLLQISSTLSPTSKHVCPTKLYPKDGQLRNISKDAFTVQCCSNFFEKDGHCEPCPAGNYGKSCVYQCHPGYFGKQCTAKCKCSTVQVCHHIFGCVCSEGFTGNKCDKDTISEENTVITITVTVATGLPSDDDTIITEKTMKSSGPSNKEWLLYTLCITGVIILTVSSHLLRSCRKQKSRVQHEEVVLESTTSFPYTGVYHEIDENVLTDVTPRVCVSSHSSKIGAVYFVPQESSFITTSTENVNTDYLDPVFAADDEGEKSKHKQMHKKDSISMCFSVSDAIVPQSIEHVNPSQFTENRHEHMSGYEVPVTVYQCIESSSGSDEDATDYKYSHVYQSLQKRQSDET